MNILRCQNLASADNQIFTVVRHEVLHRYLQEVSLFESSGSAPSFEFNMLFSELKGKKIKAIF